MKQAKNIEELREHYREVKSGCAGDTIFMARAMMFMCERLAKKERNSKKRAPTEWQRFFGRGMKAGKTPVEIAGEWRERQKAGA